MNDSLKREFEYFLSHHDELVAKFNGRYVVIRGEKVIGDYSDELEAVAETAKRYEMGTFIVQKCEPGEQGYTQTFHSRVAFV